MDTIKARARAQGWKGETSDASTNEAVGKHWRQLAEQIAAEDKVGIFFLGK